MADLRTDYKDDVLDTSKNEKRKYNLIPNEDGTVSLEDATEYSQVGDSFGSADINKTNTAVNKVNSDLGNIALPFIDTKNIIYSAGGSFTWTATDNCYATGRLTTDNTDRISYLNIDGVEIGAMLKGSNVVGNMDYRCCIPVKKGQVVEVSNRSDLIITFYGMG